jgi:hypothetical protein
MFKIRVKRRSRVSRRRASKWLRVRVAVDETTSRYGYDWGCTAMNMVPTVEEKIMNL